MKNKPTDLERVQHMINAIGKIFKYTEKIDAEQFKKDELIQDAVIKNFEILGEAAYHISDEFKSKYPTIEWTKIQGLRHILVHDYYKVNVEILWNTKNQYLEELRLGLGEILKSK